MAQPPGPGYYETVAGVIATLYVALAVELRLLRPRDQAGKLPEAIGERIVVVIALATFLGVLLLSAAGLAASLHALESGSSRLTADLAEAGSGTLIALFVLASTDLFFGLLAQAIPAPIRRYRRPAMVTLGVAMFGVGIWLIVG